MSLVRDAEPAIYFTYRQFPFRGLHIVVHGRGDQAQLLGAVRAAYAERRTAMLAGLRAAAPYLQVSPGSRGGFYLWCRLAAGRRARVLAAAAGRTGVALRYMPSTSVFERNLRPADGKTGLAPILVT